MIIQILGIAKRKNQAIPQLNKDSTGQNAKFDFDEAFFEDRQWYRDQIAALGAIPPKYFATSKVLECEIEGRKCQCWMIDADLHAEFEDGEHRVYHNVNILNMDINFAGHPGVTQDITFVAVPES